MKSMFTLLASSVTLSGAVELYVAPEIKEPATYWVTTNVYKTYALCNNIMTWDEAVVACQSVGGVLPSIHS